MTETYWHPDDKAWMAQRKEDWLRIKRNLDVISTKWSSLKRKYHKYHKELFFFGTLNPECRSRLLRDLPEDGFLGTGHGCFMGDLPVFKIWYHPRPEMLDLDSLRLAFVRHARLGTSRVDFIRNYWGWGAEPSGKMFPPDYGMMGGREELCMRFFCPELDYKKELTVSGVNRQVQIGIHPSGAEDWCKFHTEIELFRDARFVPYAPGQYLWDHMSYAVEHYPEEVFFDRRVSGPSDKRRDWFLTVIAEILRFEGRTDSSRRRPSTIAMVERLIGKYERKEFSDAMIKLWDEAKARMDQLTDSSYIQVYMEPELIDLKYGGFPVEKQEERVRQWKQV